MAKIHIQVESGTERLLDLLIQVESKLPFGRLVRWVLPMVVGGGTTFGLVHWLQGR